MYLMYIVSALFTYLVIAITARVSQMTLTIVLHSQNFDKTIVSAGFSFSILIFLTFKLKRVKNDEEIPYLNFVKDLVISEDKK